LEHTEGFFHAQDGTQVYRQSWEVEGPKAEILFIHGYGDHSGRWMPMVERLTAGGYSIHGLDYRGHGQAGGRRGYCKRLDDYLDDIDLVRGHLEDRRKADKLFVLGHSLGGLLALKLCIERPRDAAAAIVSSPFLGLALEVPAIKAIAGKVMSAVLPIVSLPTEVRAADCSRDPEVVAAYDSDPLVHHVANARFFTEVVAAHETTLAGAASLRLPLLMLVAGGDKIASPEASRRFFEAAASEDKVFNEYPGLYHEVFNEPEADRNKVLDDLLAWMDSHV